MTFRDNREFIEALKRHNDVVVIEREVDWDMEMGAIVRRVCEKKAPAPFFQKIKDYPGWRALGAPLATYERLAIAMGLDRATPIQELEDAYLARTSQPPIKPVLIDKKKAPCKEKMVVGNKVDLFELAAPMLHGGDGGRYLCTWHAVVTKALDDDNNVNWGMYRMMIVDEKTMVGGFYPVSDMGKMFYGQYVPQNKPMPFAAVIGCSPMEAVAASAPSMIPENILAGQLMGIPVELTKCETVDLEVPAHAEIIIEGEVLPNVSLEEAPFGEYTGYRTAPRAPRPACRVSAITHRDNPILTISNPGIPLDENQLLRCFTLGLEMRKLLESQGIPITGVHMLPESSHHMVIIGTKVAYSNIATQIAQLVFGSKLGPWFHMVIVVDEETDIYNRDEVIHTLSTKCHPVNGIRIYNHSVGTALNPYASALERKWGKGAKVLFDCTFPLEWSAADRPMKVYFSNENIYPKEIQEQVLKNWSAYGFKD